MTQVAVMVAQIQVGQQGSRWVVLEEWEGREVLRHFGQTQAQLCKMTVRHG